jgi:uncharacterized Zn finger protein (UPF0148 family)
MAKKEYQEELKYECPECGEPVSKNVLLCPYCGAEFLTEEEEEELQKEELKKDDKKVKEEPKQEEYVFERDLEYDDTPYYLLEFSEDELYEMLGAEIIELDKMINKRESKPKASEISGNVQFSPSVKSKSLRLRTYIDSEEDERFKRERLRRMREERFRKIAVGRRFFDAYREKLYIEICIKFRYCEKCREYKDVNSAFYAIMGIISTFFLPGSIGGILGAILIKKKLERFCRCGYIPSY